MIGLIPAAGKAERMHGLPKFLLPTPQGYLLDVLYRRMALAKPERTFIGTRVIDYDLLNRHAPPGAAIYIINSATIAETLLTAPCGRDDSVMFGMPDTYFEDEQAFIKLVAALDGGADVAVGLFEARPDQHKKVGMCCIEGYQVVEIVDKPDETDLTWVWGVLAWKPTLWRYINAADLKIGDALDRAIVARLDVRAVPLSGGYYDCGTPDEYFDLIRHLTTEVRDAV